MLNDREQLTLREVQRQFVAVMPGLDHSTSTAGHLDAESQQWVDRLRPGSPDREAAVRALHALLLSASRFEVNRRQAAIPHLPGNDHGDLAQQGADDALVAVLGELDGFRGDSRFTTWAYKFALLEAATKLRHRAWQGREVPLEPESWPLIPDPRSTLQHEVFSPVRATCRADMGIR